MCPAAIKIPLKGIDSSKNHPGKAWSLLSHFYLKPFLRIAGKSEIEPESKERILQFVDSLVHNWSFTA